MTGDEIHRHLAEQARLSAVDTAEKMIYLLEGALAEVKAIAQRARSEGADHACAAPAKIQDRMLWTLANTASLAVNSARATGDIVALGLRREDNEDERG